MAGNTNSGRLGPGTTVEYQDTNFTVKCPSRLNTRGKRVWKEYVGLLGHILQDKDAFALERLCSLRAHWEAADKIVQKKGTVAVYPTANGPKESNRLEYNHCRQMEGEIKNLETRFGLTPKDGEKIKGLERKKERKTGVRDKY